VAEGVGDVREQPRLVQEFARPQVGQRAMQLFRRQLGHGLEQREGHLLTDHGGKLQRRLLSRAEPVDARGDDRGNARRNFDLVRPPSQAVGAARAREHARVHEATHALLEEQRIAVARLEQALPELREIGRVAKQAQEQRLGAGWFERVDAQLRVMHPAAPAVPVVRPVVHG
jgi:hypothetical protein